MGPASLIIRFNDGKENRYHVDHVKARIQGGEREPKYFQQTELDSLPAIVTAEDRQANVPLAPALLIPDIDQGPEPVYSRSCSSNRGSGCCPPSSPAL